MTEHLPSARSLLGLSLVFALAACGGYTTVDLGGSVNGLTTDGLVLANGNDSTTVPANATSYKFANQVDDQASYDVTVKTQPARLTCTVANGSGHTSGIAITNVNVSCTPNSYSLGGTVTGLTTTGLVLTNGSDTLSVPAYSSTFTFPTKVNDGSVYGVAVLSQPAGQTCSIGNGTAVMGAGAVTSVQVSCI